MGYFFVHFFSKLRMYHQHQLDIARYGNPSRRNIYFNGEDAIKFVWDSTFPYQEYDVLIESLSAAGEPYKKVGPLERVVIIPRIAWGSKSNIALVPRTKPELPKFLGVFNRGMKYIVNSNRKSLDPVGAELYHSHSL